MTIKAQTGEFAYGGFVPPYSENKTIVAYGMMHRMAQASQQSQARGETTSQELNPAQDATTYKTALEQIANSRFITGLQAQGIARDALGIKPKGGAA